LSRRDSCLIATPPHLDWGATRLYLNRRATGLILDGSGAHRNLSWGAARLGRNGGLLGWLKDASKHYQQHDNQHDNQAAQDNMRWADNNLAA